MASERGQGERAGLAKDPGLGFREAEFRVHRAANLSAARAGLEAYRFDRNLESVVAATALTGLVLDPAMAVCLVVLGNIILQRAGVDFTEFHREAPELGNYWDKVFGESLSTEDGRGGELKDVLRCLDQRFA